MKKIVVMTGAGISAESGISTFRDAGGLWEGHDVTKVASPEGWNADPNMVLDFYNQRRAQLHQVKPNDAHLALVELEQQYQVSVITQNIDNLHERAGSSNIIHLHGELFKARSIGDPGLIYQWEKDIQLGDVCEKGHQLRPHIVWFGEEVPMLATAANETLDADIVLIIGTSMQVYPAAGLVRYAPPEAKIYYVDPRPSLNYELDNAKNLRVVEAMATQGVPDVVSELLNR